METNKKGLSNPEDLQSQQSDDIVQNEASQQNRPDEDITAEQREKRKHHGDHSVSRKYKMFSNHSSDRDMPHTNTSF